MPGMCVTRKQDLGEPTIFRPQDQVPTTVKSQSGWTWLPKSATRLSSGVSSQSNALQPLMFSKDLHTYGLCLTKRVGSARSFLASGHEPQDQRGNQT
jgi:hypothetical protein